LVIDIAGNPPLLVLRRALAPRGTLAQLAESGTITPVIDPTHPPTHPLADAIRRIATGHAAGRSVITI
jgi:hypothetical protein